LKNDIVTAAEIKKEITDDKTTNETVMKLDEL
jgi:hypothetical protein